MATYTSNTSTGYSLVLTVTEASTSVANNTSTVNWSLVMKATTAYCQWNPGAGVVTAYINGQAVYNARPAMVFSGYNSQISIGSGTVTVSHNNDGTKTCGCSASYSPTSSASYLPGSMFLSGTLTMSTIPRATTPSLSASNVTLGSAVTISLARASSSFTHDVTYQFGNTSGTIATGVGTSCSWTPDVTLAQQIPNAVSGTGTITVVTKNGSTTIGTKSVSITLTVPSSVAPSISAHTVAEATANLASKFGVYVQSKSTLKVTTSAAGAQGSTIRSIMTVIEGKSYSGSPCTTGTIQGSGTITVQTTVTDTRGRTASKTTNITVIAYSPPQITASNVTRTSDESTTATAVYSFSISSVGSKNTHVFYIQYLNGSTWTDIYRNTADYGDSGSVTSGSVFGVDVTTKVRFVAQDYFTTVTIEKEVGPTFTLINYGANGKSIALGSVSANDGTFQCMLPIGAAHRTSVSGSGGYLKILTLKILNKAWNYGAIEFKYFSGAMRGKIPTGKIILIGGNTTDPSPDICTTTDPDFPFWIHKSAANTWDVYVQRTGSEQAAVFNIFQYLPSCISWSFANVNVSSLPSGVRRANWEFLDACYPVGSIIQSSSSTNPGSRLGGTWSQIAQGRMLIGVGSLTDSNGIAWTITSGQTGGVFNHNHCYGIQYSHVNGASHIRNLHQSDLKSNYSWINPTKVQSNFSDTGCNSGGQRSDPGLWNMYADTTPADNAPPFLGVYFWKRTA
ncbi:DUF859 family phage minor structural protein [Ileibacterium valens]|uniref:Baseplate structural protein Gp10 C-terminal domain-containing protein n=2 Tax=Erysipelotrichaceae TaxID=128827 RepID=A0A1U7NH54_9FIRM|nr:DUF859 family phage minor structural protein [Ileibacterium valens]OLU37305.1 hypothetical protein BM735_10830 [Erysipelotrichaceae bacterium NYU-BL-F16]OLU40812.1 hypothetical protein BO222_04405 [Ileibacterium valens]OLU41103.1 hypothetical protein BO224_04330 [Erysipelotrichaceae bacterium NYU-BL-E8]